MRESHLLEDFPNSAELDCSKSIKVYGKLDFKVLAGLKENITLLSTFDGLDPNGNIEYTKFKVLLAKKYLKNDNAFYIYGSICYPHDPLNEKELIHPLLYINRDEDDYLKIQVKEKNKDMILAYYAYRLAQNISPVRLATLRTDFSDIAEWYRHLARLNPNFEGKLLDLNDSSIIVAHPPYILEYVTGAYDFNMPSKKKEELLEIEVEKGFKIINLCHEFSKALFLDHDLLNDLRYVSPINAGLLKNYMPKNKSNIEPKQDKENRFKEFLSGDITKHIIELIFARPLSMENFDKRLEMLLDAASENERWQKRIKETQKALERIGQQYSTKSYKKVEEIDKDEEEILKKYGLL